MDAAVRWVLGAVLLATAVIIPRPFVALGIGFLAVVFLGTALLRVCPLYLLIGGSTERRLAH